MSSALPLQNFYGYIPATFCCPSSGLTGSRDFLGSRMNSVPEVGVFWVPEWIRSQLEKISFVVFRFLSLKYVDELRKRKWIIFLWQKQRHWRCLKRKTPSQHVYKSIQNIKKDPNKWVTISDHWEKWKNFGEHSLKQGKDWRRSRKSRQLLLNLGEGRRTDLS